MLLHSQDDWIRYGDEIRRPLLVADKLNQSSRVCIIGAGLSGLTIAYRIASKRPDINVNLLEKGDRCGGVIETWTQGEWSCDVAVNAARPHPAFWRLVNDLGLGKQYSQSNSKATSRWIYQGNRSSKLSMIMALKMGPFRLFKSIRSARTGGKSVSDIIPNQKIADAMTLGIVNDVSSNVDADFLMPSLTRFGEEPPIKWSKIKKKMKDTYPIFSPEKGTIASLENGMQTLIDALVGQLETLPNVRIECNQSYSTPLEAAELQNLPLHSIIWCAPASRNSTDFTDLDIYAVGYSEADIPNIPLGYGTLIPDPNIPISGILHESDVHQSPRAPLGHRLFRIMAPINRNGNDETIKASLKQILSDADPVLFENIGKRRIPSYPPGYMKTLNSEKTEFTRAGWFYSGVSITHVVAEAERIADLF